MVGENPLPTLVGESTENGRFFTSSSQPLLMTTPPPIIEATSVVKISDQDSIKPTQLPSTSSNSLSSSATDEDDSETSLPTIEMSPTLQKTSEQSSEQSQKVVVDADQATEKSVAQSQDSSSVSSSLTSASSSMTSSESLLKLESSINLIVEDMTSSPMLDQETTKNLDISSSQAPSLSETKSLSLSSSSSSSQGSLKVSRGSSSDMTSKKETSITNEFIETTKDSQKPFLGLKVSRLATPSRPLDLPRVAPSETPSSEPVKAVDKKTRQSDEDQNALPGVNDILTGLLNVVGEGLTFATNFVKEENERKKEAAAKLAKEKEASLLAAQLQGITAYFA